MNKRFFIFNWLLQLLIVIGTITVYKTYHNQFLMFFTNYTGFFALLASKVFVSLYLIVQLYIALKLFKGTLSDKRLITLTIISLPLMGWLTVINAILVIIYLKK